MARNPQASAGADAWERGFNAAGPKLDAGVNRVTESPAATAARNLPYMRQRFLEAMDSGHTQRRMEQSPLGDWKSGMSNFSKQGLSRASSKGKPKYSAFAQTFYPVMAQASAAAQQIDKSDWNGKLARVRTVGEAAQAWKNGR